MTKPQTGRIVPLIGLLTALFAAPAAAAEQAKAEQAPTDCQGAPSEARLNIAIENLRSAAGVIDVTLYPDDPPKFLKRGGPVRGFSGVRAAATRPVTRMCFWLPGPGAYAISVYHDANENKNFDQNSIGLPLEGFGFSNNPTNLFGPPAFETTRFVVPKGETTITIRLRYVG